MEAATSGCITLPSCAVKLTTAAWLVSWVKLVGLRKRSGLLFGAEWLN